MVDLEAPVVEACAGGKAEAALLLVRPAVVIAGAARECTRGAACGALPAAGPSATAVRDVEAPTALRIDALAVRAEVATDALRLGPSSHVEACAARASRSSLCLCVLSKSSLPQSMSR